MHNQRNVADNVDNDSEYCIYDFHSTAVIRQTRILELVSSEVTKIVRLGMRYMHLVAAKSKWCSIQTVISRAGVC